MNSLARLALASTALVIAGGTAHASTVVATDCISVADAAGCLFAGNINGNPNAGNVNSYLNAQNAYNLFNNTHPSANPDITLTYLGDTNAGFPGTFTGAGTSSGTWSLPGFLVDYVAVKAGDFFVLYQITPASSGSWNTFDIPYNQNPRNLSHLAFFGSEDNGTFGGVPEPATWLTMILGFGAMGWSMRNRKRQTQRIRFAF